MLNALNGRFPKQWIGCIKPISELHHLHTVLPDLFYVSFPCDGL